MCFLIHHFTRYCTPYHSIIYQTDGHRTEQKLFGYPLDWVHRLIVYFCNGRRHFMDHCWPITTHLGTPPPVYCTCRYALSLADIPQAMSAAFHYNNISYINNYITMDSNHTKYYLKSLSIQINAYCVFIVF